MENRPVDPGSIQGSHRPISFIRIKHRTGANDNLCKCLMYQGTTQLAKLSFNHSHGRTHSWRFSTFYKMVAVSARVLAVVSRQGAHSMWSLRIVQVQQMSLHSFGYCTCSFWTTISLSVYLSVLAGSASLSHVYIPTHLLIISCNNIVLIITTALYAGSVCHVSH